MCVCAYNFIYFNLRNLIDDIKQIEFLNLCSNLKNLTLYGNPICSKQSLEAIENKDNKDYDYRREMIKILPDLKILDDELTVNISLLPVRAKTPADYQAPDNTHHECPFDDDWQLINQFIEEGIGPSEDKLAISESLRPGTCSSHGGNRISTGVRPLSSMRPLSSYRIKTGISSSSNSRGNTAEPSTKPQLIGDIINDSSNLTVGPALQGNPFKALLARKKPPANQKLLDQNESVRGSPSPTSTKSTYKNAIQSLVEQQNPQATSAEGIDNEQLHAEINVWKKEHARKLEERKEYFEPQVLKIEDDPEPTPLSDTEDTDEEEEELKLNKETSEAANFRMSRVKSAFKQHFDYEVKLDNENEESPRSTSRVRSASKDKNLFVRKMERNDSDIRLATGDTGYDSLASASISSYQSLINNNNKSETPSYNLKPVLPPSAHKPKIVTTSILTTNNTSNLKVNLKSNLKPLPGIKPPKS